MANLIDNSELTASLKKLGVANLRPCQEAPLRAILVGKDVFVIMPTGGGKSLLFELPAVMDDDRIVTLVISPLRALQEDQVASLRKRGVPVLLLNSDLTACERAHVLEVIQK